MRAAYIENTLDFAAFRELFDRYFTGLVMYATEFSIAKDDAEDLVQDVFVILWEKRKTVVTDGIKTYLFKATKNKCLNYLAHLKVRSQYQNTVLKEQQPADTLNTEFYVECELQKLLEDAIDLLPPQRKKVFMMSRFEGKSFAQIADELNISPNTVDKHIHLALMTLRQTMAKYMPLWTGLLCCLLELEEKIG